MTPLQKGLIAADADLEIIVRQWRVRKAERGRRIPADSGKPSRPASFSGLMATIVAPARFACCSAVSIRGWFVPGFCPRIRISSVFSKSSSVTVPLPMPMVDVRAEPDDSWHMFEQSGRLFVPNCRTKSW